MKVSSRKLDFRNSVYDVEARRKDPNSPLCSEMLFQELCIRPELLKGIQRMGFSTLSKIQEESLPRLLADPPQNMIAQSQSGTGKTIAFVLAGLNRIDPAKQYPQTRKTAAWLCEEMGKIGHPVALLSGELSVEQRKFVFHRFYEGILKVIITTNVCARGIDVAQVNVVINFDLPIDLDRRADCETYLHRIGRAGRFGHPGLAISMAEGERSLRLLQEIENHYGHKIALLDTDDGDEIRKIFAQ